MTNQPHSHIFIKPDSRVCAEDVSSIAMAATLLYFQEKLKINYVGTSGVGVIYTKGEDIQFGDYFGRKYYADIETPKGSATLEFLIYKGCPYEKRSTPKTKWVN
ncbi:hypothetical protein J4230_03880 [Candidatus Woesearchaeota archaeon]|nr:hypothetical protein [Candidatus Woesearchaeota archaeon]